MEQGNRLDSTFASAALVVGNDAPDTNLNAAVARLLTTHPKNACCRASFIVEAHPDAALLAAAEQARPFVARYDLLEAELARLDAITDAIVLERHGPRPDVGEFFNAAKAHDEKRDAVREETGRNAAWVAMSNDHTRIWDLLGPFTEEPAKTLEGAAAKSILAAADLWSAEDLACEVANLYYNLPVDSPEPGGYFSSLAPIPDLSRYTIDDLRRTYDVLTMAIDIMGLSTWATSEDGTGDGLLDGETDRLAELRNHVAGEMKRREPADRRQAIWRTDTLIHHAVANGSYEAVTTLAASAHTKRLG